MSFLDSTSTSVNGQPTPNPRPSLPRSYSTPSWPKNSSMESLRPSRTLQTSTTPTAAPVLRKRHSTYALLSPNDRPHTPVPVPGAPPKRPLRNPARMLDPIQGGQPKLKAKSRRPSTATGTREDITPWEFSPGPTPDKPPTTSASLTSSPIFTRARPLPTGPVSEVTPWDLYPVRRSATSRSSLTTGLVEEVTPWELHPVPTIMHSRSTLATGPVEEVTPWELAPTPPSSQTPTPISEKRSARVSTSSGPGKTLSEFAHLRRRKSTTTKAPKLRSNTLSGTTPQALNHLLATGDGSIDSHTSPTTLHKHRSTQLKSAPTTPRPYPTSSHTQIPTLVPSSPITSDNRSTQSQTNLRFSTADRTILEELKRGMKAREAQFVMKGEGSSMGPILGFKGKRHHAFPSNEVPYPRDYEREVMDLDVWETAFCQDICESLTWHVFESPPAKVLDLGCGTGTWILNCARTWKSAHFVGLDIVPLQPDLQQVGSSDLASRITWIHHNLLEGLPFPNEEFDFVHIKRIALGVPEDKWDFLFEEICRVMKPGGAFEMLEEDLFFPGKLIDGDSDSDTDTDSEIHSSLFSSRHDSSTHSHSDTNLQSASQQVSTSTFISEDASPSTPTTATLPMTPSRSNSPVVDVTINEENEKEEAQELLAQVIGDYAIPLEDTTHDEAITHDAVSPATIRAHLHLKPPPRRAFASSAVSLLTSSPGSTGTTEESPEHPPETKVRTRPRGLSFTTPLSTPDSDLRRVHGSSVVSPIHEVSQNTPPVPLLLRTVPKAPPNPRDHSLLEEIYTRLLESRFINLSPLALLTNSVGLYFKDVRTHPPLQYRFPAAPQKSHRVTRDSYDELSHSETSESDSDDARDAILPSPVPRGMKRDSHRVSSQSFDDEAVPIISEDSRYVNVRGLINHSSPYISLDESRANALSPSIKGMFPGISSTRFQRGSFLPNNTRHLDLKTLNLHLALRAAEVMACSESMWEWVLAYQDEGNKRKSIRIPVRSHRSGSGSIEIYPRKSIVSVSSSGGLPDVIGNAILDLTRGDFNGLLSNFEMDMRDHCALAGTIEDRLSWSLLESTQSPERKVFDTACEKWAKWEQEQITEGATVSPTHSHHQNRQSTTLSATHHSSNVNVNGDNQRRPLSREKRKKWVLQSSGSVRLSPTHRMSRAMRVFVAWKAGEI